MADNVLPTLSSSGWVESLSEKANRLFAYYFTSMKSQTALYGQSITSLQWTLQDCGHDMLKVKNSMQQSLQAYLNSYYDYVSVDVQIEEMEPDTGNMLARVYATVQSNGVNYSFGKLIQEQEGILKPILDFNNDGVRN